MKQILKTFILASIAIFLAISLVLFPDEAFKASIRGLDLWWEIVFPSLLPFFITAELLISFGVVSFLGVLFEPIMRPLFRVPGAGSFGWIMGMASGYPTGAKIAVRLREEGQVTRIEAERLLTFTNASSPLFIFGAVSIGFFHDAKLGILLAISHYLGNALVGISMRFYGQAENKKLAKTHKRQTKFSIINALREMHRMRIKENKPLGQIVSDAVINSIKTLIMVGGFIILFSVLTKLIYLVGISTIVAGGIQYLLQVMHLPADLAMPFFSGLFEITLGSQMISELYHDDILYKAIIVSFLLGFNGFSIQSQVASIVAKTDIRFAPYFFARILHGIYASLLTFVLYVPLYVNRQVFDFNEIPVQQPYFETPYFYIFSFFKQYGPILTLFSLLICIILLWKSQRK